MPQYIIAFGTGGFTALQLLTREIPARAEVSMQSVKVFVQAQRGLVLINAVVDIREASFRSTWSSWRKVVMQDQWLERHERLAQLLLSDHYLTQVVKSRDHALTEFFRTRSSFLQGPSLELLRAIARGLMKNRNSHQLPLENLPSLAQPFGVIVAHGSVNALSSPSQVQLLLKAVPQVANSVQECVSLDSTSTSIFVAWLKSGHEIVQERSSYMYDLLRQLILAPTSASRSEEVNHGRDDWVPLASGNTNEKTSNNIPLSSTVPPEKREDVCSSIPTEASADSSKQVTSDNQEEQEIDARVQVALSTRGIKWIQQELYDRDIDGSGTNDMILRRYRQMLVSEARAAHEKAMYEAAVQLKREAAEMSRRAKRNEELDRIVREQESQKAIQRKEYDAQKAFFAQMEKQRAEQAQWTMEHQLMQLEDVRSRKWNDQIRDDALLQERNCSAAQQVAELEMERDEQEREAYQVHLQQRRLEDQRQKRDALKAFQSQFEQDQFVCSAVDAYTLDVAPTFENFTAIRTGAGVLAKDLKHFYQLKLLQIEESNAARKEGEELKSHLADAELAVRNLERVLSKAKTTGMIAKAGLGTVRIVPITQAEMQSVSKELDEMRDKVARLSHDYNLLLESLAWKDKLLQRLSVLIKRNAGFRNETLKKLQKCADSGNEMVLCIREDIEKLFERRDRNSAINERLQARRAKVTAEKRRAEEETTEFFDSELRIEGTTQRVLRVVVLKEMDLEHKELEKRIHELSKEEDDIRAQLRLKKQELAQKASATHEIEEQLRELEAVVPPVTRQQSNGKSGVGDVTNDPMEGPPVAEQIRHKKHSERTAEEKEWVALDFSLNFAYYYKHVNADEVDIIQRHPDYQTCKLTKDQLKRLLELPARNCLAVAFISSTEELRAHALLRKYTFGDGEEEFERLDKEFVLPQATADRIAIVSKLEDMVGTLEGTVDSSTPPGLRALLRDDPLVHMKLLTTSQTQIPPHKSVTHTFRLPVSNGIGVLSLSISIVFQGHFRSVGYQNGRLAAMLYLIPSSGESTLAPLPIGRCSYDRDISLCTPHSMGKLVLRHDPNVKPLNPDATYQVVLGAPVLTTYSIEVVASVATFAHEVLRKKRSDALKKQELLPIKKDEIRDIFVTIQLSERKKRLARKMANEAQDAAREAELDLLTQTKRLKADDALPQLTAEERRALHSAIHKAETTFTEQCFLFAKREEEARDVESGLKELTKIHADLLTEVDAMERDLVEYREYLPRLAAAVHDTKDVASRDAAGARLARELNAEYVNIGTRSSKVLWAELSAMKAKLPSMMTPAERLRRKYKKGQDVLEKKEREWVILDRILNPRVYEWEERLVVDGNYRMRLHGAHPRLTKDEEQLAVLSQMEVERILKAPWNLLERKEIQIRKIVTRFRDDTPGKSKSSSTKSPMTMVTMLRAQPVSELTSEEREWRQYDRLLNPVYYPATLQHIADELQAQALGVHSAKIPAHLTREDLVMAINSPEDELYKLPSELLRARNVLLKYDPQLSMNLVEAARLQHGHDTKYEKVEMDIDARCRTVYAELQRAIANTRNEYMDSSVLHTTIQRFPTKVLRLELEKELDRLLMSQIYEREQYELKTFLASKKKTQVTPHSRTERRSTEDSVSESDSDEEAQIAREQKAQKKAKEDARNGPRDKVRGKTLKQKTIQKQRREIKDALQGRSLEEQRRLVEEQELGVGGCMACRSNPCQWKPYLEESHITIQRRIEALQEELERVKRASEAVLTSTVCMTAVKAGNREGVTLRKSDLFDELTLELKIWDKHLRLRAVDDEFHSTFRTRETHFETKALHGFAQVQLTEKVQKALQREHNLLVAQLTSHEVVEDILESMLEGWVFGERESQRVALGFVPSLKRDGPLTMHDLRRLEQERRILEAKETLVVEENIQGIPQEKWKPIEMAAFEVNEANKAVKQGSSLDKQLTETEQALRFGIFCMTLMYFRGLSLLKKQKSTWSTSTQKNKAMRPGASTSPRHIVRLRMELEAKNVETRARKAQIYDEKAKLGHARKQKVHDQRVAIYRRRMVQEHQKVKRERHAAIQIQRMYRGHMGRKAGRRWMIRRREIDAQRALDNAAAVTLQRIYRGRLGRIKAEERRIELAEFISQIRAEEAIAEEEEYWRKHRIERVARQVAAFVKKQA
ncbi:hypothetical protein PINS_up011974 [Pythium insidiosum]|nr:hypothetical protein PINS_up011974 [Pythium insidiosum]